MSLETGQVVSHTETDGLYATHFINAYEEGTNLVADIVRVPWYALANYTGTGPSDTALTVVFIHC